MMKLLAALQFVANPDAAELFLVPAFPTLARFPFNAKCLLDTARCTQAELDWVPDLLAQLPHLGNRTRPHLFILSNDRDSGFDQFFVDPPPNVHATTLGPGRLVIPSLNPPDALQPDRYANPPMVARDVFVVWTVNARYRHRELAKQQVEAYRGPRKVVSWVPLRKHHQHKFATYPSTHELYLRSVFVPCPGGDRPYQKRFFDALLCGAIPVVFAQALPHGVTWWTREGHEWGPTEAKRPAYQYQNWTTRNGVAATQRNSYPDVQIPYEEFVEVIPHSVLETGNFVEHLARIPADRILAKLRRVAEVRGLFGYNFNASAPDAFSVLLRNVHRHVILKHPWPF